jgi:phosphoribosyl 1,2-cyclic phosphodiesterase
MKFIQHYSSSKGNLCIVEAANGRRLMLECGVRWNLIQKALDFKLDNIDGCLLSHEHKDHSKAAEQVIGAGKDVYASEGTLRDMGLWSSHRTFPVWPCKLFEISETFEAMAFKLHHDAAEPLGYIVHEKGTEETLYFSMDSSHIKARFGTPFSIIAIELSYQVDILERNLNSGEIDEALAKRLLMSHASKATVMDYIDKFCNLLNCRQIHLLHTSAANLDRPQAVRDFTKKFCIKTIIKGIK